MLNYFQARSTGGVDLLFNSYEFIFLFLPISLVVFFLLAKIEGKTIAALWIVLSSFFFYGWWDWHYVPLLFASICFNYFVGERIKISSNRKAWLAFGIGTNLAMLGYYKYTGFFLATINDLAGREIYDVPTIILPLGISFFTFTQTAYLLDVHGGGTLSRDHEQASFLFYCEFVTVFPHLIAGPIIDHRKMMPQFFAVKNYSVDYQNLATGLMIFIIGLFKKVLIADRLSPWVGDVFARADSLTFIEAWLGAIGYTFQLYFDFSGYSEMAIGLGRMFNLSFPTNFDSPYQARSIIDFWRRWHMTLGLWVKEYLYIPFGGNRQGELLKMRNLFFSMLLIGFWHGAGWTFIFWGALHGILLMINHQWRRLDINFPDVLNWGLTFLSVTVCWVFFRAESFREAVAVLWAMVDVRHIALPVDIPYVQSLGWLQTWGVSLVPMGSIGGGVFLKFLALVALLLIVLLKCPNPQKWILQPSMKWMAVVAGMFFSSLWFLGSSSEFLYFQF